MFPEDKIIEIFSICDDFSKVFDKTVDQNAIIEIFLMISLCDGTVLIFLMYFL